MLTSSNHTEAFVQCRHGKHTVASSQTLLSNHVEAETRTGYLYSFGVGKQLVGMCVSCMHIQCDAGKQVLMNSMVNCRHVPCALSNKIYVSGSIWYFNPTCSSSAFFSTSLHSTSCNSPSRSIMPFSFPATSSQ